MSNGKKFLSPKLDVVFQALFGKVGSERITIDLLEAILKEKIESIDLTQNTILQRTYTTDKLGILDIFAKFNQDQNCNIEMQLTTQVDLIERILFYWSKMYIRQIKKGNVYEKLNRTILILICDFDLEEIKKLEKSEVFIGNEKELEKLSYHTKWNISETKHRKIILTDKLEFHIINLSKARSIIQDNNDKLLDWLMFLENPKSEKVKQKMEDNEILKEAAEKLDTLEDDELMQRIADLRLMSIADEHARAEARMIQARLEGEKNIKLKIAKKMLKEGLDVDTIIKITNLKKEEILE